MWSYTHISEGYKYSKDNGQFAKQRNNNSFKDMDPLPDGHHFP